jgi:probable DNA metabolism protein
MLPAGTGPVYVHDGTFEGLMSVIYEATKRNHVPEDVVTGVDESLLLFSDYVHIAADRGKAERVIAAVKSRLPENSWSRIIYAFLSEERQMPLALVKYVMAGWNVKRELESYCTHDAVKPVIDMASRVSKERHRMLGLLRFRRTADDIYYAPMEPDHNILPVVTAHFSRRMAAQRWIIHDRRRNMAALHEKGDWQLTEFHVERSIDLHAEEALYQELWRGYFSAIAIQERKNKKLQRQLLPARYWKHLVEGIS